MLTKLSIQGLRGLEKANLDGLSPVTVLVGPNGSGKTTVLEACGALAARNNAVEAWNAVLHREWLGIEGLRYIVRRGGVRISGDLGDDKGIRVLLIPALEALGTLSAPLELHWVWHDHTYKAQVDADGAVSGTHVGLGTPYELVHTFVDRPAGAQQRLNKPSFSSALRDSLTAIKLSPLYDDWLEYLRTLRPTISSIESISVGDRDEPFVFEKAERSRVGFPLAFAGDGFRRSLLLAGAFARAKTGIVAIDEPEAFAHPSLFTSVAKLIRRGIADKTQVLMATHSLEFVGALLDEFASDLGQVAVFGLSVTDGKMDAVRIAGDDAQKRVHELGHDLRL